MIEVELARGPFAVAIELLADGATNAEIGERLGIAEDTVKSHVKAMLKVSGCAHRTEFVTKVFHKRVRLHGGLHTRLWEGA